MTRSVLREISEAFGRVREGVEQTRDTYQRFKRGEAAFAEVLAANEQAGDRLVDCAKVVGGHVREFFREGSADDTR